MPLYDVSPLTALVYVVICAVVFALWFRARGTSPEAAHKSVADSLRAERLVAVALGLGLLVYADVTGSTIAFIFALVCFVVALGDDYVYRIWR